MIRRILILKTLFLLVIMGAVSKAGAQELKQGLDLYLTEQVRTHSIPGLTAAVVRDGALVYIDAFGVRQIGKDEKLTPEHVFHFAAVPKPFVATAYMQLAPNQFGCYSVWHTGPDPGFERAMRRPKDKDIVSL